MRAALRRSVRRGEVEEEVRAELADEVDGDVAAREPPLPRGAGELVSVATRDDRLERERAGHSLEHREVRAGPDPALV